MPEDGQREPGSGGTAHRGRPGAGQARRDAGGESPPGDGQDHAGTPRPDALIPALEEGQLAALREIGRAWDRVSADPQVWRQALPVDPSLGEYPEASEVRPALFTRFVPVAGQDGQLPPIQTTSVALPVLSADALSSVAYGPQAMLAVLVLAGLPGLSYSLPAGAAIVFLMLAVGVSYRQTIRAYPQGGGSYILASEELGRVPGLMAAAGLLIDYIMTVAVSIASGVAAFTSAYPPMQPAAVWIGVSVIVILLAGNLRGVHQGGYVRRTDVRLHRGNRRPGGRGAGARRRRGFHPVPVRHLAIVQAVTVLRSRCLETVHKWGCHRARGAHATSTARRSAAASRSWCHPRRVAGLARSTGDRRRTQRIPA